MDNGIFTPMFGSDGSDDLEDWLDVADEMVDGARLQGASIAEAVSTVDERNAHRSRIRSRQEMLLVQRLVEEWPETKDCLRQKVVDRFEAEAEAVLVVAKEGLDFLERSAARFAGIMASEMMRAELDRWDAATRLGAMPATMHERLPRRVHDVFRRVRRALNIEAQVMRRRVRDEGYVDV